MMESFQNENFDEFSFPYLEQWAKNYGPKRKWKSIDNLTSNCLKLGKQRSN
jgi:hypothetical protein